MADLKAAVKATAKPVAKTVASKAVEAKTAETKTVEVKAPAAKAPAKKAATKAPVKKAAAKAPAKKAATKAAAVTAVVNFQFAGKSYTTEDLVKIAKDVWVYDLNKDLKDFKTVELYVKPEESTAYYVVNEEVTGCFGI